VLFAREPITVTLPDVLHAQGKRMFAIAETEKYAHVTYFFSGGREKALATETRVLIPSITAHNYIDLPEMSAREITATVLESLQTDPQDFYLINYANPDMVGHSGNFAATVKAIEFLDGELKKLYDTIITHMDGTLYITSDHGNAEQKRDEITGQPHTAHTTNKVPFIMIQQKLRGSIIQLPLTQLADVAPFILRAMELPVPKQMLRVPTPNP
jgi:2,3-bisphosphoglycerate-independent phosphoglycerate mutase